MIAGATGAAAVESETLGVSASAGTTVDVEATDDVKAALAIEDSSP